MKLVHKGTGAEVQIGDSFERGLQVVVVTGWTKPTSPASTGRIYVCEPHQVKFASTLGQGFYPSVYDCEWIEREDR